MTAKRGRPPVHKTDAEREAANKASRKTSKQKFKNVSLDADLVEALNGIADRLESEFGFRPTLSQAVRYLIKKNPLTTEEPS